MKKVQFIATLAVGVNMGFISQNILAQTPTTPAQSAPMSTLWPDTEEDMLKRMNALQDRLNELEKTHPDSIEALSKQIEAQGEIEGLLTKYREAKQVKFASYVSPVGTVAAAAITGIVTGLLTRRKSKRTPDASPHTNAAAR
jgi:hypothetical protein